MNTTIRRLVRECPECGNIVKLVMEGDKILEIEGAEAPRLSIYKRNRKHSYHGRPVYSWSGTVSNKIVRCIAMTREHLDGRSSCWKAMRISKFKEIIL